jgi:peroxiredoxin family protein
MGSEVQCDKGVNKMKEKMKEKMTIIVFSGEMDKVMASFILATGAAAEGMDVTMFFTFWGLNVIKKNEGRVQSRGFMRKMLNWMNRGGSRRLPLSKFDMLGMGRWMMKKLMKESKMPTVDELIAMAKEMGVRLVACTTTMGVMGLSKDAFIPEVDSFAGASTYLGEAKEGKVNLFI